MKEIRQIKLWDRLPDLVALNALQIGTMGEAIGMSFTAVDQYSLKMRLPVDERTVQPAGRLHGGASAALAETIGSVASYMIVREQGFTTVGIELNCSHLRGAMSGYVYATCRALRIGRSMHVWNIDIEDDQQNLLCVSRLTVAVIKAA